MYADDSLSPTGKLTDAGRAQVDKALAAVGAESLESAKSCIKHPL
ncbi:hypothetical protein ACIRD6_35450 [Streptomyces sp. NPDC102473]